MTRKTVSPRFDTLETRRLMSARVVETEPNDARGAADVIALDSSDGLAVVSGVARTQADTDWYTIKTPKSGSSRLRLSRIDGEGGALRVEVVKGRRTVDSVSLNTGDASTIQLPAGRGVRLRIRTTGLEEIAYTLSLRGNANVVRPERVLSGGTIREIEPNETSGNANRFVLPNFAPVFLRGLGGDFDLDTYSFQPSRGGLLQIDNLAVSGPARYLLETDEFPNVVQEFATIESGGSATVPVFRGLHYRLRWIVDAPIQTPYLIRLQVLPNIVGGTIGDLDDDVPTTGGILADGLVRPGFSDVSDFG